MPTTHKSISEAFPDLEISQSRSSSKGKIKDLSVSVKQTIKSGWPSWATKKGPSSVTVRLADFLQNEAKNQGFDIDPAAVIETVRRKSVAGGVAAQSELWEHLEDSLIDLVYGSNRIEDAGNNYGITIQLCRPVFRGVDVDATIQERDPEYAAHLVEIVRSKRQTNQSEVIRSRREIIQHAQALNFVIDRIILDGDDWTEEIILQTHRTLYAGLHDDVDAGQYRNYEVAAAYVDPAKKKEKKTIFIRSQAIKQYMADFVANLNNDIKSATPLDPYSLAAKYHHQFVCIHPFGDGNGRMSRIILNMILLKYAGHITAFGGDDEEKDAYLGIAYRASRKFHEEDGDVVLERQVGHHELARYVLTKSKAALGRLWHWGVFFVSGEREVVASEVITGKSKPQYEKLFSLIHLIYR